MQPAGPGGQVRGAYPQRLVADQLVSLDQGAGGQLGPFFLARRQAGAGEEEAARVQEQMGRVAEFGQGGLDLCRLSGQTAQGEAVSAAGGGLAVDIAGVDDHQPLAIASGLAGRQDGQEGGQEAEEQPGLGMPSGGGPPDLQVLGAGAGGQNSVV